MGEEWGSFFLKKHSVRLMLQLSRFLTSYRKIGCILSGSNHSCSSGNSGNSGNSGSSGNSGNSGNSGAASSSRFTSTSLVGN